MLVTKVSFLFSIQSLLKWQRNTVVGWEFHYQKDNFIFEGFDTQTVNDTNVKKCQNVHNLLSSGETVLINDPK